MTLTPRDNAPSFAAIVAACVDDGFTRRDAILAAATSPAEVAHASHGYAERWVECDLCDEEVGEPDDDDPFDVTYDGEEPFTRYEQGELGLLDACDDPLLTWYAYLISDTGDSGSRHDAFASKVYA